MCAFDRDAAGYQVDARGNNFQSAVRIPVVLGSGELVLVRNSFNSNHAPEESD